MNIRDRIMHASDSACSHVAAWGPLAQSIAEVIHRLFHIFFGGAC